MLYPVYAAKWDLSAAVTTSVFGVYPLSLLLVLLFFGSLSDTIGRRKTILIGVALIALSAIVFAIAPNVGFLYLGRVLQGVGTGFAIGAASAALVENNYTGNPRIASSLTTVSTSAGLTLALVISGLLAEYAPLPLVLSFVALLALTIVAFVLTLFTPHDETVGQRWTFALPRVAPGMLRPFVLATISVSIAYAVGAMFLSLGADMAREFTGTTNLFAIGALLGVSSATIGITALFLSRMHAHTTILIGGALSVIGLGLMAAASATGSILVLLLWCIIGGMGYSFSFTGGLSLINRTAPAHHRGATLSLLYLLAYVVQAVVAIGAGMLATALGLQMAVELASPILAVFCLAAVVLVLFERRTQPQPA
ncbi:MFS transporter [Leifsonia kafniensis]|uniref:MFS transporter n=1 Tax=Leifsonia kafniensis TaxID=475957 RepID=A0ABP7K0L0_9MICO